MTLQQKEKLFSIAKALIGKPYRYGAKPEDAPEIFDCSSFMQYLFGQIGIKLPRSSILQAGDKQGKEIVPHAGFSNLEIGDLIFMRGVQGHYNDSLFSGRQISIGHVGVYLGNGKVIHASSGQGSVAEQNLSELTQKPNYAISLVKRF